MKRFIFGFLIALVIAGSIGAVAIMTKTPAQAQHQEMSQDCSWGQLKACFNGGCNSCCPENCKP